eukprot:TRINITY_DN19878_c0_g1_i1.p1 TRINITY_DN19878_c0_g1~~TRINITY_DN19878_c0_g1_i1.p1  ORF type:complete len:807 (+),score=157.73 TRINITY_DN19878_c0_g1_i1:168-2588(+)
MREAPRQGSAREGDGVLEEQNSLSPTEAPSHSRALLHRLFSRGCGDRAAFGHGSKSADKVPKRRSTGSLVGKLAPAREPKHQVPGRVMWSITTATAVLTAAANFAVLWATYYLADFKLDAFQLVTDATDGGVAGAFMLAATCAGFGFLCVCMVVFISPCCAGGGLPEVKGLLNGTRMHDQYTWTTLLVRIFGIILAVSAGLPLGREGPMITIGCNIGVVAALTLAAHHAEEWVETGDEEPQRQTARLVDETALEHVVRIAGAIGGAAGMATIFNAPLGGLLYMLEDVTVTWWAEEFTFQAFVCTVVAVLVNQCLFKIVRADVFSFLIYVRPESNTARQSWKFEDLPFFMIVAIILGLLCIAYTKALLWVFGLRGRLFRAAGVHHRVVKVAEATLYCFVGALIMAGMSALGRCQDESALTLGQGHGLLRYICAEGEFNVVASIILRPVDEVLEDIYAPSSAHYKFLGPIDTHIVNLLLALVAYTAFNIGMAGMAVPMGFFIPPMFIGALFGRIVGKIVADLNLSFLLAHEGTYALIGSAALLSGFTHKSLAIVIFLVEFVNDLTLIPPLMVAIGVTTIIRRCCHVEAFDDLLIDFKAVPYLKPELPERLQDGDMVAADFCERYPAEACFAPEAAPNVLMRALEDPALKELEHFPVVVDDDRVVGLAARPRLEALLEASNYPRQPSSKTTGIAAVPTSLSLETASDDSERPLLVSRVMDSKPHRLLGDTPVAHFYPMFARLGVDVACVVGAEGKLLGVLTRARLILAAQGRLEIDDLRRPSSETLTELLEAAQEELGSESGPTPTQHV